MKQFLITVHHLFGENKIKIIYQLRILVEKSFLKITKAKQKKTWSSHVKLGNGRNLTNGCHINILGE